MRQHKKDREFSSIFGLSKSSQLKMKGLWIPLIVSSDMEKEPMTDKSNLIDMWMHDHTLVNHNPDQNSVS